MTALHGGSSPHTSPAIVAEGLTKRFGTLTAVHDVHLDIPRGAAYGFIGENGAGKTTFIKLLLGICRPTTGRISVLGGSPHDIHIRRRIGYLPERLTLPPAFSPLQFLSSVGRLKGLNTARSRRQIPEVLNRVGLDESAWRRRMAGFSKGMRQRTGLAAALLGDPELLILDEPTDGIDPMGRAQIRDIIHEAKKRGVTLFLNSHLLAETERICSHISILSKGRVVLTGPISTLRAQNAHRVRFSLQEHLEERAVALGFSVDHEAREAGLDGAFLLEESTPERLSNALHMALQAGLLVEEVSPQLRDLEEVLAEAVRNANGGTP